MHFLISESEDAEQRAARRAHTGQSSGETYAETLRWLVPDAAIDLVTPSDADADLPDAAALAAYDAVFVSGSPLHVYDGEPATERQLAFMRQVFASGTPCFGSCAGLQLAVAAAGGEVGEVARREAGVARRIARTDDGHDHPLLDGRPLAWDAPAVHGDEVKRLPPGGRCLAGNATSPIQAVEIVHGGGTFWGVQYHPEVNLAEMATALRRDADTLVEEGFALTPAAVEDHAALFDALHRRPDRLDLRWRLGLDQQVADRTHRTRELANFVDHLVRPIRARRHAATAPEEAVA